jgi:AcrR family transcriptional regulator
MTSGADVTRAYRGVPAETRRAQRRAQLVETALDALHTDGLGGVSVRSICARARLTPRYFYESFDDLDALLVATVDAVVEEVADAGLVALDGAPDDLAARVRATIDAAYGVVVTDPRKGTALLVAASGYGPLRERRHRVVLDFAALVVERFAVLPGIDAATRRQSRSIALFLMGGSTEVIEAVLSGRQRMSRTALVDHLTELWLRVLRGSG